MRSFLVGLALTLILIPSHAVETWRTSSFEPIRQVSYQIRMLDGTCSAVAVGVRQLLTAAHCVNPDDARLTLGKKRQANLATTTLVFDDGVLIGNAKTVRMDALIDLALLETDFDLNFISVGETPPRDSYAYVVGYPLGVGEFVTFGFVQLVKDGSIYTSVPVIFGNSGGGLFVVQDGRYVLVGIASFVFSSYRGVVPHVNGFVDTDSIRTFLGVT